MLDRSRPLWEQQIIDGLPGDRFAFYSKLQAIIARRVAKAQPDTDVQSLDLWFETVRTLGADWVRSRVRRPASGVIAPYAAPESILNRPLSARRSIAMCSSWPGISEKNWVSWRGLLAASAPRLAPARRTSALFRFRARDF